MRRTARSALFAVPLLVVALATGCSTTVSGAASPSSATPPPSGTAAVPADAVAWVDGVCGSLLPVVTAASAPPKIDSSDPQGAVTGLRTFLGDIVTSLDTALSGLKAAGPSPVAGGDELVTSFTTALTPVRSSFQDAKAQLDAVDPTDLTQVAAALPAAFERLQQLSELPDPRADLKNSPELDRAARQAPNCRTVLGAGD